jgi:CRISPR-associated endonuclease/helicase Cas3
MLDYQIELKPVYSAPAPALPPGVQLPAGWSSLAWHQAETFAALNNPEIDVIFNTAMTGDGKSLAAYLRLFCVKNSCAIGLYPTNELARDQEMQLSNYIEKFDPALKPRLHRLNSAELELYSENEGLQKSAALLSRAGQSEILLTNPDIFHYLHHGCYLARYDNPDRLWGQIDKDFELIIFDEFHIFSAPQVSSIINLMLLIRCTNRFKKFLFLSATPNDSFIESLRRSGFRCQVIDPQKMKAYQHPESRREAEDLTNKNWRQVVRKINLAFMPMDSGANFSEKWLKEHPEAVLEQLQEKGSKGAILLNSIASVKRLTPFFQAFLQPYGFTVGENTGLSSKSQRQVSLQCDLVIGTSAIDVGIDFKINFLFFESADSGNFIQRLGRLGRHDGTLSEFPFQSFRAFAFAPQFFVERLFLGEQSPLSVGQSYERPLFHRIVEDNYRNINTFHAYYPRWGSLQSFQLFLDLNRKEIRQAYEESRRAFRAGCEAAFNVNLSKVGGRFQGLDREWREISGTNQPSPIHKEASKFRGSSDLQCGLYDLTESNELERFKRYDLAGVLSHLEIETLSEAEFKRLLAGAESRTGQTIAKGQFQYCLGFMKLVGYREERLNWKFIHNGDVCELSDRWQVQVVQGLEVFQPENPWIREVNRRLKKQALVAYVLARPVAEVRARLQLPLHFQLYPLCDLRSLHDGAAPYSIAFGQSALMIETQAYCFKQKRPQAIII